MTTVLRLIRKKGRALACSARCYAADPSKPCGCGACKGLLHGLGLAGALRAANRYPGIVRDGVVIVHERDSKGHFNKTTPTKGKADG